MISASQISGAAWRGEFLCVVAEGDLRYEQGGYTKTQQPLATPFLADWLTY